MINPAVISLASLQKFKNLDFPYRFEIEDNIGEAVHIHFKDIRLDFTVQEFERLAEDCEEILEELVNSPDFKVHDFDPMLLTTISKDLLRIERIEKREVFLEDILVDTFDDDGNKIFAPIFQSRVFKAMCGADKENEEHFQTNYTSPLATGEISNNDRINYNLEQIKKFGYPHGNELIGIDHHNRIWDGQHRACSLYYLYGNIKVPVRTIYFRDNFEVYDNSESDWLKMEQQLYETAEFTDKEVRDAEQEKHFFYRFKKAVKKIFWAPWARTDFLDSVNSIRFSEIEKRLCSIEEKLSEKQ